VLDVERSLSRGLPTDVEPEIPAADHFLQGLSPHAGFATASAK
jgi:hypothetical protein